MDYNKATLVSNASSKTDEGSRTQTWKRGLHQNLQELNPGINNKATLLSNASSKTDEGSRTQTWKGGAHQNLQELNQESGINGMHACVVPCMACNFYVCNSYRKGPGQF